MAEVDERDELLVLLEAEDRLCLRRLEEPRGAPVGGEASRVCSEQDDVDGTGRREQVFPVLVGIAGLERARDDERGSPAELRGLVRRAGGDEPVEGLRAEHAEAPRLRQVVVGGPPCELEQLLDRPPLHRLPLVGLVRPARPDCGLDLHAPKATREAERQAGRS